MLNPIIALFARLSVVTLSLCAGLLPAAVWAGGGAHVVDDDAVLDPGVCHAENWVTLFDDPHAQPGGRGLVTVAPACTFADLPGLELAVIGQHAWDDGTAQTVTPAAKYNFRPASAGWGIAASAQATVDLDTGRVEGFAVNLPVTVPVAPRLMMHGNLGWIGTPREQDRHALFWGVQAEYFLRPDLVLMGEVFGQDRGAVGGQAGLRWVTDRGRIDVDLLAGRNIDGSRASSVTLGITIRR